ERVGSVPGVKFAAIVNDLPLRGSTLKSISIEGRPDPPTGQDWQAGVQIISPQYFDALAIPIRRGRSFDDSDRGSNKPLVIINEVMARRHWEGEDPIGKRILLNDEQKPGCPPGVREIVGVVGDVRHSGLESPPGPEVYVPYWQSPSLLMSLVVRPSSNSAAALTGIVRREVASLDKDLPVARVSLLE